MNTPIKASDLIRPEVLDELAQDRYFRTQLPVEFFQSPVAWKIIPDTHLTSNSKPH